MKRWSKEESRQLKELYLQNKTNIEMAVIMGRSTNSVSSRLHKLGISRPCGTNQYSFNKNAKNGMTGKKHTEEAKKRIAAAREKYIGEKCPSWKGGRRVNHNGYIQVRVNNHPRSVNGYVFEHILIAEAMIVRGLMPGEVVHHIDGDRSDNTPTNLMVFRTDSDHIRYHAFINKEAFYEFECCDTCREAMQ